MDLDAIRAAAGRDEAGTLILVDGRRIAVLRVEQVGDAFLTFTRPAAHHPQMIACDEVSDWVADAPRG